MGYLVCEKCGGYYELGSGESPDDFDSTCDCGGILKHVESLDDNFNYKGFFSLFDISNKENRDRLKDIGKKRGFMGSVIVGVLFSVVLGAIFGILSSGSFWSVIHSVPIKFLPLISAGIVSAYIFKGNDLDLLMLSSMAGIISAILNAIGNLIMIILFDSQYLNELSYFSGFINTLIGLAIQAFIYGGILGVLGGFLIYLYKKN